MMIHSWEKYFEFLDSIPEEHNDEGNDFFRVRKLAKEFNLTEKVAQKIVIGWILTSDKKKTPKERASQVWKRR